MRKFWFGVHLIALIYSLSGVGLSASLRADEPGSKPPQTDVVDSPSDLKGDETAKETDKKDDSSLSISGVFESLETWELENSCDQLASLKIERIVVHGSVVEQGETVVWFESEAIDKQLASSEIDLNLARLAAEDDQFAYEQFLEIQKLDREAAQLARKLARQAYDNYVKVDRQRTMDDAKYSIENSEASLENVSEELKQLTQMYEADDLTEESEEIVLKRTKRSVELAQRFLDQTKVRADRTLNQTVKSDDASQESVLAKAELSFEKSMYDLESAKKKRDFERQRSDTNLEEKEKDFAKLKEQRKSIVLKAPGSGILLYDELTRAAVPSKPSMIEVGYAVPKDTIIATIVARDKFQVRMDLIEEQLPQVEPGAKCKILPTIAPETTLDGVVKSVSKVPYLGTKYDCIIEIKGQPDGLLYPAMTCKVKFETPSAAE